MGTFVTINGVKADAHAWRVTLNILRHSTNCPLDLEVIVDRLAGELNWNRHGLTTIELESLYAHLDSDLVSAAVAEWNVETHRMRDWTFAYSRRDWREWWDGETLKVDCRLCGHRDNRFEFPLVNDSNGNEIWTGSTCIVKYGVTVDGDACAETALAKLRDLMGKSKKAQTRHQWREQFDGLHEAAIERIRDAAALDRRYMRWDVRRSLPADWRSRMKEFGKWGRAAVKYYDKNGYLSPQRTSELWEVDGNSISDGEMLLKAAALVEQYVYARDNSDGSKAKIYWTKFISDHPNMNDYQRGRIQMLSDRGYTREALRSWNLEIVREIEEQHAAPKKPAKKADNSDLPF